MLRSLSTFCTNVKKNAPVLINNRKMKAWQIHAYGDLSELQLSSCRIPVIKDPNEVLIKVNAASVNPIDMLMLGGYGRTLFQIQRSFELELPLTLGRDFSGTIIAKGHAVSDKFQIGEEVYGFIPIHKQGSFAEAVLADENHLLPKPKHIKDTEVASLVYTSMTAWGALFIFGNLLFRQTQGLRVLILGASGGVGTAAVQLLKSQGCSVFATCSTDAIPLIQSLGADCVYDYNDPGFEKNVELESRYHIILDGAKVGYQNIPKTWKYDTFITLNSPLLLNTDSYGLVAGLVHSVNNLLDANFGAFKEGSSIKWGFFVPSKKGFHFINNLICEEKIKPVIHKTFNFEELPAALKTVSEGHLRGKVVINYKEDN